VFSVRFLVVGVPYHGEHLSGITENVMNDLKGVELWEAADLGVGVYNTEDGLYPFHFEYQRSDSLLQVRICARSKALLPDRCVIKFLHRPSIGPSLPGSSNQLLMLLTSALEAQAVSVSLLQKTWMGGVSGL
jgi:hypothetical protein